MALAVVVAAGELVPVRQAGERQTSYTANTGELTAGNLVGQTFTASRDRLSAVAVMIATYSGRVDTGTVQLQVRKSAANPDTIRTAAAGVEEMGNNQLHRFDFKPIENSKGKKYFFLVTSPGGRAGSAVTVDISTEDPYPLGSAYIVRGQADSNYDGKVIAQSGKQAIDTAFELYYTVPLRQAVVSQTTAAAHALISSWGEERGRYLLWATAAWPAILTMVLLLFLRPLSAKPGRALLALFLLAVALRLVYAHQMPLTNDEGNYLYDARTLLRGKLAGGDGYVKAPLVVGWLALWQFLLGNTIAAGRWASVFIGAATLFPLYWLGKNLGGRKIGLAGAGLWALLGVTSVFNIYVHTQPLAVFFGTLGLAVLLHFLRGKDKGRGKWLFAAGVLLGLGVISRKSILALGLVPLALIVTENFDWKARAKDIITVAVGFLLVVGIFLAGASAVYGTEGFWEALGANSAEDSISGLDPAQRQQVRAYSIRGMTPFFRESLPLILLSLIGLGVVLQRLAARSAGSAGSSVRRILKVKLWWAAPLLIFWWAWGFFSKYEGSSVMVFDMERLWYAMAAVLLLAAVLYNGQRVVSRDMKGKLSAVLAPALWLAGLLFFYMNWIKFHANYIGEFLPPLVLLAAFARPVITSRKLRWAAVPVLLWALFVSGYVTLAFEHTGTFQLDAAKEAANWAQRNIPMDEPIFTGAAVVPYLSGHRAALDIAHPRWYAYEFTRKDTGRLNTFLPPAERMVRAFRDAKWFLMDKQTDFSFLMEYPEIKSGLESDFERVQGISNGSNTLTFYKRIR